MTELSLPGSAVAWFLPFVLPVCLWVAWSDLAHMKIPNRAVLALVTIYLLVGPVALPLEIWLWRWLNLLAVLIVGFILHLTGSLGAGDAKFAAAAAPFIPLADGATVFVILAAMSLAALIAHRGVMHVSRLRNLAPNWSSWDNPKFPLGLPLAGTLVLYLTLTASSGQAS